MPVQKSLETYWMLYIYIWQYSLFQSNESNFAINNQYGVDIPFSKYTKLMSQEFKYNQREIESFINYFFIFDSPFLRSKNQLKNMQKYRIEILKKYSLIELNCILILYWTAWNRTVFDIATLYLCYTELSEIEQFFFFKELNFVLMVNWLV